jgi:hypothetical protein
MKPDFIGIGAQKCATSWVYRVLEDHPEAALSDPKELHFFSHYFDRGYQWYERHFEGGEAARACGEYSTSYIYNADAAARAHAYNPEFRLIVTLRDPVARAYSNHLHEVRSGHITSADRSFEACEADNPMYVAQSRYAQHLRKWLAHFPAARLLVLFQEEIAVAPAVQAARLYRFLGLDEAHVSPYLHERVNVSAVDRSGVARDALQGAAGALRAVAGERFVRDLRTHPLVKRLRQSNKQDLTELIAPIQDATEARLRGLLADDMRELAQLLGRSELPWRSWRLLASE